MPVLSFLHPLKKETLRRILTEPKNSLIKQYTKLFEMDGIKLSFEENVLDFIVDKSVEFKLGARGLRSIVEGILTDAMFEMPSQKSTTKLVITRDYAQKKFDKSNISKLRVA
jgi:ATP-dependent Clp protease ATP-binding subunit ClpX